VRLTSSPERVGGMILLGAAAGLMGGAFGVGGGKVCWVSIIVTKYSLNKQINRSSCCSCFGKLLFVIIIVIIIIFVVIYYLLFLLLLERKKLYNFD
jgi:hypothetical protein